MKSLRATLRDVREFRRGLIALNLIYFGVLVCVMVFAVFRRDLQQSLLSSATGALSKTPISEAYTSGHLVSAILVTFAVNLIGGSVLYVTFTSLIVPFSGVGLGLVRAVIWGLMFSPQSAPATASGWLIGALTGLLILLEGEGYVLAMFGAYLQGWTLLHPREAGVETHGQAYWLGLWRSLRMYWLVAPQLAVAAIYEALFVIVIRPHLM